VARARILASVPLYDFRCRSCGTVFEARVAVSATAPCPACAAVEVERVYSPVASTSFSPSLKGDAARRSDDSRRVREEKRHEGFRKQREQLGLPPRQGGE
jgi:putative FmdB family regulatory protein